VWNTRKTLDAEFEFLTSDRPVLMTASISETNAYILLPIGPRRLFVAVKDQPTMNLLQNKRQDDLVRAVNRQVVAHAVKYAYGTDAAQLRFVQNHLSTVKFEPLFSRLDRVIKEKHPWLR
jgi:Protein of unknown function (DUF4238)